MKISIDIDCTPEEARTFLGLPDVKPVQDAVVKHLAEQTQAGLSTLSPDTVLKAWLQPGVIGIDQALRTFGPIIAKREDQKV